MSIILKFSAIFFFVFFISCEKEKYPKNENENENENDIDFDDNDMDSVNKDDQEVVCEESDSQIWDNMFESY
ncbi:MAG TPA: hypothetical protein VLJ60_00255, partial [bacterium]|nr:hypothetical protein [bacterium]